MRTRRGLTRTTRKQSRVNLSRKSASRPRVVSIRRTVQKRTSGIPFEQIALEVMSASYELSLVICGDRLARTINKKYRRKTYAANVLSFPLQKYEGEIFLNIQTARREAKKYGVSLPARLALLYVHGLFHLKGLKHGDRMEAEEKKILKKFGF